MLTWNWESEFKEWKQTGKSEKNRRFAKMLMVAVVVIGVISAMLLNIDIFYDFLIK